MTHKPVLVAIDRVEHRLRITGARIGDGTKAPLAKQRSNLHGPLKTLACVQRLVMLRPELLAICMRERVGDRGRILAGVMQRSHEVKLRLYQ